MSRLRSAPKWLGEKDLVGEAGRDGRDEGDHQRFDPTEPAALQRQHDQDVSAGNQDADEERDAKKELQRHG
jgi:hypothetical protein